MDFKLWHTVLTEAVYWQDINEHLAREILHRTAVAWAHDQTYYMQGVERVDLTKLYEQCKLIETIKGHHHGQEITSDNC
jgi:hypothetical protein